MDKCFAGMKAGKLQYLSILSPKLERRIKTLLLENTLFPPETNESENLSVLVVMSLPNPSRQKKTDKPGLSLDEKSKPCEKEKGCAVFQMHGCCKKNCELRSLK